MDERKQPEIQTWWKENVGSQSEEDYTRDVIDRFENDPNLKLIIVVDKLLTGFDEPKNAVLYIDKPLKQHNLLQAIARVNCLHDQKKHGLLIDYRGILAELDTTLAKYDELAAENVGGYDPKDIAGLYSQMSTEYRELPTLHKALWAIFDSVKNRSDIQQLRAVLMPRMVEEHGQMVDASKPPLARLRALTHAFIRSECAEASVRVALDDAAPLYRDAPEAAEVRQAGNDILQRFMREVLPNTTNDERTLAGDIIRTTFAAVGKAFSETPRSDVEIAAYADAMADMFEAYLLRLSGNI